MQKSSAHTPTTTTTTKSPIIAKQSRGLDQSRARGNQGKEAKKNPPLYPAYYSTERIETKKKKKNNSRLYPESKKKKENFQTQFHARN